MMHVHKKFSHLIIVMMWAILFFERISATPMNNPYDSNPIHTIFGLDKSYIKRAKNEVRLHLSPFYQQTSTARDNDGKKVPGGDRLGPWNMYALFFNKEAAPVTLNFNGIPVDGYKAYGTAGTAVKMQTELALGADKSRYRVGIPPSSTIAGGLTAEDNFDEQKHTFVNLFVPTNYEKMGIRSQFNYDFAWGLGFCVKAGVADIKYSARRYVFEDQFTADYTGKDVGDLPPSDKADEKIDAQFLYTNFMAPEIRERIASEVGLDIKQYHKVDAEDILFQLYWHWPRDFEDEKGDIVATIAPYLSLGLWVPAGKEVTQDKLFSVPTGNNGFVGLCGEFSLAFDFPIVPKTKQKLQSNIGIGFVAFNERNITNARFPSSRFQSGIIPWKVGMLSLRPGFIWHFNASMMAYEFINGLSVYFDYMYTQHTRDHVEIKDSSPIRLEAFTKGKDCYVSKSSWRTQQFNTGFNYRVTDKLSLGAGVQSHISGIRVQRAVTILGGISFII